MNALLSIRMWFEFIGGTLGAMSPVLWVLLPFVFFGRDEIRRSPALRLFLCAAGVNLSIRLFTFFSGVPYQSRYFYPLVVFMFCFGGLGFVVFCREMPRLRLWPKWLTRRRTASIAATAVILACGGKIMSPRLDKKWLRDIPATIVDRAESNGKIVLVSQLDDGRLPYYAEAEYMLLNQPPIIAETAALENGAWIMNLPRPYRFRKGFLRWESDADAPEVRIIADSADPADSVEPKVLYDGRLTRETRIHGFKGAGRLRIIPRRAVTGKLTLRKSPLCQILAKGDGVDVEDWIPVGKLPPGPENIVDNLKRLGGRNAFLLTRGRPEWIDGVEGLNLVKSFPTRRKGELFLYRVEGASRTGK